MEVKFIKFEGQGMVDLKSGEGMECDIYIRPSCIRGFLVRQDGIIELNTELGHMTVKPNDWIRNHI